MVVKTSQAAWHEAEHHAKEAAELDTAELIENILGHGLFELENEVKTVSCLPGGVRKLESLVKNAPSKRELEQWMNSRSDSGKLVFVPMVHEFDEQPDPGATAFQQTLSSFITSRACRTTDVLMLEGFGAGVIKTTRLIRQLRDIDELIGARTRNREEYSRRVFDLRSRYSVIELALNSDWSVLGAEHLWANQLSQLALVVEDSKPIGTSIQVAYLSIELRNRIAIACASEPLLRDKRPVLLMGALHSIGLKAAALRIGIEFEIWPTDATKHLLKSL